MLVRQSSRIENGQEICNTCVRPVENPFRYRTHDGLERGCVAECHDVYVRHNTKPNWMAPRYVLPKWITECRAALRKRQLEVDAENVRILASL